MIARTSPPHVLLDASPVMRNPATGIGRATALLIEHLLRSERRFRFTLFSRRLLGPRWNAASSTRFDLFHLRLPRCLEPIIHRLNLLNRLTAADLYHATDFYLPLNNNCHAVATVYDVLFLAQPDASPDNVRLARWTPGFARRCRIILTISEFSKNEIVRELGIAPAKVRVIHLGVDPSVFHVAIDPNHARQILCQRHGLNRPFFLAVSCGLGRKNSPWLLRVFADWARTHRSHDLVLVWSAPAHLRKEYTAEVAAGRIRFLPSQPDPDLARLYQAATALIFPSRAEGFGLPIIEAMSCETPVICGNETSLPEAGGTAAFRLLRREADELTELLNAFASNRLDSRKAKALGLAHARRFTWDAWASETASAYAKALGLHTD